MWISPHLAPCLMKPRDTGATRALTVAEAADYLSVDLATIYRLPKRKELPAFKVGCDWRFNLEQIDRWRFEREIRNSTFKWVRLNLRETLIIQEIALLQLRAIPPPGARATRFVTLGEK